MRAPIGDGAAGVIPPPTESVSSAFLDVRNLGCLAEPHVPIEARRYGLVLIEGTFAEASGNPNLDGLKFSNEPVAKQFAGGRKVAMAWEVCAGVGTELF